MLKQYNIALLTGDGVGPELMAAATEVLNVVERTSGCFKLSVTEYPFGKTAYEATGKAIPEPTLAGIKASDASLLGAIAVDGSFSSPVGFLRKELGLYADIRPVRSFPNVWSLKPDIDLVCIRENTEGFLADRSLYQGHGEFMPSEDLALSLRVVSREACERISRYAFEYARKNNRKKITLLHKNIIFKEGCGLFLESARKVGCDYPEIELTDEFIDIAANKLICSPGDYDILLTTNLFGDIISDEAAGLVSSMVPTANIGSHYALFIPIDHSARFELAGKGVVNPLATFLSIGMLMEHLGEKESAQLVNNAVVEAFKKGLFKACSTAKVTNILCEIIQSAG